MQLHSTRMCCFLLLFLLIGSTVPAGDLKTPVTIGATVSLDGKYREPSLMIQKAFQLWADETNQGGGLLGRPVKLVLYNDKSDRDLTKTLYKKIVEDDKVDLVFSPYGTPLTLVASEITEQNDMLMLAVAAASEKPWQKGARYLFQMYAPANRQFIGLLDLMARKNLETLSVIYDDTSDFNVDIFKGVREWAHTFNRDIVYQKTFRDGKKDLPQILAEVKGKGAQALIFSAYPPDCYELLRLLGDIRYRPPVLAMPIVPAHPDFQKKVGPMANHVLSPSQWEPDRRMPFPGTQGFIKNFNKFTGYMPSFHAASAFSACRLYEKAIEETGSIDNRKLRDYIAILDTVTVLGRFKVDSTGKQIGHNTFIIQWQNGKKEIVWPRKMQTAKPLF